MQLLLQYVQPYSRNITCARPLNVLKFDGCSPLGALMLGVRHGDLFYAIQDFYIRTLNSETPCSKPGVPNPGVPEPREFE